jgi:hypothetical protein
MTKDMKISDFVIANGKKKKLLLGKGAYGEVELM